MLGITGNLNMKATLSDAEIDFISRRAINGAISILHVLTMWSPPLSTLALPTIRIGLVVTDIHVSLLRLLSSIYTISCHPHKVVSSKVIELVEKVVESIHVSS
jgi:hypothetical protein